ncbi:quinohemoprotein amine dehydrogenase subunit alpha [Tropicimonas sp. IMCC34043]|uniref:quinohemoprotein amine dehydrogenase subunit alpha n=1 Tax=Tropicimonas sp. IMCC34043 TaxID=2248760 RepID=UPI000E2717F1|nr:quinohemoprotein amine dehydrogenase subunit alpha [Tropicimonas sp. IMCC34043]
MTPPLTPPFLTATAMALILPLLTALPAAASEELVMQKCAACHSDGAGGLTRIPGARKTPEGWLMTIVRMRLLNGLMLKPGEEQALVQYLSDTQGLAPSEAEPFRYALERDPSVIEADQGADLNTMCGRCHTVARFGLQRMTPEEWDLNTEFHMGHNPSIEYQATARDREWYRIAKDEVVPYLAEIYPFDAPAWDEWLASDKPAAAGEWVVLTEVPGLGPVYGTLEVTGEASPFAVSGSYVTETGQTLPVTGSMNFYSGYEWRANVMVGDLKLRQILAIDPATGLLSGRQFVHGQDSLGGAFTAAKAGNGPVVLGTLPEAAPAGSVSVQIVGADLPPADGFTANAYGSTGEVLGESGPVEIALTEGLSASLTFYDSVDSLQVEPAFTIARVGGGGGLVPDPAPAYFKAVGFWNGPDGAPGTEDDIRIGVLPASWSVSNHGEVAEAMQDAAFAGTMDPVTGIFMPAVAGPNPDRPFSTNNAGELVVTAEAAGVTGDAELIVTVQRFVDPPIR